MPDDDIGDDSPTQEALPRTRRIRPNLVAVEEADGAMHLRPLRQVPGPLWRSHLWRRCALPDWAADITNLTDQFLALVVHLASQQQDAIDALQATLADLRAVRRLIAERGAKDVVPQVDEIGKRIRNIVEDLNQ